MTLVALPSPAAFDFTHRGDYSEEDNARPVVTVEFAAVDARGVLLGAHRTGVLVDSGARTTLLGFDVAQKLGLDLSESRYDKTHIEGIKAEARLWCAKTTVLVELCGQWFRIPVFFSLEPGPTRPLLGRTGVFDRVRFAFGHAERAIYCAA